MASYARVTLTDIQGFLLERVGGNSAFWPTAQLTEAINHALRVWQCLTGEWTTTQGTIAGTGVHFYSVPTTEYAPHRVSEAILGAPLVLTTVEELDLGFPEWDSTSTGTPLYYAHVGADMIAVHPAPSGITLSLESYQVTPTLSAGGDFIQVGDEILQKLLAYAHHYLTMKEGGGEFEATKGALEGLIEAAVHRNRALRFTNFYRGVGRVHLSQAPTETLGMRG